VGGSDLRSNRLATWDAQVRWVIAVAAGRIWTVSIGD
jgi:hypothetical protein